MLNIACEMSKEEKTPYTASHPATAVYAQPSIIFYIPERERAAEGGKTHRSATATG